jgi:hypothetical protein
MVDADSPPYRILAHPFLRVAPIEAACVGLVQADPAPCENTPIGRIFISDGRSIVIVADGIPAANAANFFRNFDIGPSHARASMAGQLCAFLASNNAMPDINAIAAPIRIRAIPPHFNCSALLMFIANLQASENLT